MLKHGSVPNSFLLTRLELALDRYWPVILITKRVRCPIRSCNKNNLMTSNSFHRSLEPDIIDNFHEEFGRLTHEFGFTPELWGDVVRNRNRNCNAESFDLEWIEGIKYEY